MPAAWSSVRSHSWIAATPPSPSVTGTVSATPSMPYSPARTTDAVHGSPPGGPSSAATMRAIMWPDVQVEDRPESSATWRVYQLRTKSSAAVRCSPARVTGAPSTRTRSSSGTQESPCSPITHASTRPDATPSASPIAVRSRSESLDV